jgi:hypothetical protein
MNFGSLNYFLLFKTIRKDFKRNSHNTGPNPARCRRPIGCGILLRKPAVMASRPDWCGLAGSSARPALSPGAPSALSSGSLCTERPGWCGHRRLATGLGAAALMARASACYRGPAGQHESGEGSLGRWRDGGVVERYRRDGGWRQREVGRRLVML